jgi:hypothetical protein
MASALSTLFQIILSVTETGGDSGSGLPAKIGSTFGYPGVTMADGSSASQANKRAFKTVTLGSGASSTLDLYGGLTDPRGTVVNFTRVVDFAIYNSGTVAGVDIVRMGNAASNPWSAWVSAATATTDIGPGGVRVFHEPSAAGLAVANGSTDNLKILNLGTNSIDILVAVVGS